MLGEAAGNTGDGSACDEDEAFGHRWISLPDQLQEIFTRDRGHLDIAEDEVIMALADGFHCLGRCHGFDLVAAKQTSECVGN